MSKLRANLASLNRRQWLYAVAGLCLIALVIIVPQPAHADAFAGLKKDFFNLISYILLALIKLFGLLTGIFVAMLVYVAQINTFIHAPVVAIGWPIVRDITNMFYIVTLLIIAAGTILRLENYRYNRLLAKLIVMAFLSNVSIFIAGFLIQAAQVVMLTFVNAFRDVVTANFANMFGIGDVLQFPANNFKGPDGADAAANVMISLAAGLAMMIVAFSVTLAITVMLFIRVIALWVLLILSPIAYTLRILPNTEKYAAQWWSEFSKYVVIGPVLAFFLWVAMAISQKGIVTPDQATDVSATTTSATSNKVLSETQNSLKPLTDNFTTKILEFNNLFVFMTSIIFLMMGLNYATKSGAVGASFAGRVAKTGFAVGATLTGARMVGNAIADRTYRPVQGWLANRETRRKENLSRRTAGLENVGDRVRGTVPIFRQAQERAQARAKNYERAKIAEITKEQGLGDQSDEVLQQKFQQLKGREQFAALQMLQSRGKVNLSDAEQANAFNRTMADTGGLTRSGVPTGDILKLREAVLGSNMGSLAEADLRTYAASADSTTRTMAAVELEKRKALSADSAADRAIIEQTRRDFATNPAKLKEFENNLKKSNPEMALATVYNGLSGGLADAQAMMSDVQQGLFSTGSLNKRHLATMARSLRAGGMAKSEADSYFGNQLLANSRTKDEYDKHMNAMSKEARDVAHGGMAVGAAVPNEHRGWLAGQGFIDEAHTGNAAAASYFVKNNAALVAKNLKEGKVSKNSLRNQSVVQQMMDERRIGREAMNEMAKNNPELRTIAGQTAHDIVAAQNANMATTMDTGTEAGRREINRADIATELNRGGNINGASVLDTNYTLANAAGADSARRARQNMIRRNVGELRDVDRSATSPMSAQAQRDIVVHTPVGQLNKLADVNPAAARDIAAEKRAIVHPVAPAPGTPLHGEALTAAEIRNLDNQGRVGGTLDRSDRGL